MGQLEFLERLDEDGHIERWIVREGGAVRNAHLYADPDYEWLVDVEQGTRAWIGFLHPRVVPVVSCQWLGTKLLLVIGDQRGPSLLQAARQLANAPVEREAWAVAEIIAIGEALGAMARHQPGFIHRRPNPEQLTVGPDGHVQLRAPIAQIAAGPLRAYSGRGRQLTSVRWMAPEQVRGQVVTPAADVYQLAATLYTALAGKPPFKSEDGDFEMMQAIVSGPSPPPPPARTPGLAEAVMRGLSRAPAERPPDPAAFAAELWDCAPATLSSETLAHLAAWRQEARPAPGRSVGIIGERCTVRWEELTPTADEPVRHCQRCSQEVVQVRSIEAVIPLLGKRCFSYRE